VIEPLRLWETESEFGFLYNKWSLCSCRKQEKLSYFEQSLEKHAQALAIAKASLSEVQVIDSLYNIAFTHLEHAHFMETEEWISKGFEIIDPEFRNQSYYVDNLKALERGNIRWLMIGKLYSILALAKIKKQDMREKNSQDNDWIPDFAYSLFSFFQYSSSILSFIETIYHLLNEIRCNEKSETELLSMLRNLDVPEDYYIQYVD